MISQRHGKIDGDSLWPDWSRMLRTQKLDLLHGFIVCDAEGRATSCSW